MITINNISYIIYQLDLYHRHHICIIIIIWVFPPKSSMLIGFFIINLPFWGTPTYILGYTYISEKTLPYMMFLHPKLVDCSISSHLHTAAANSTVTGSARCHIGHECVRRRRSRKVNKRDHLGNRFNAR